MLKKSAAIPAILALTACGGGGSETVANGGGSETVANYETLKTFADQAGVGSGVADDGSKVVFYLT